MIEPESPASSPERLPPDVIPRLPVLGWASLVRPGAVPADSLLAAPGLAFTTSGRAAIWLALKELGIGAGDCVLIPSYHCPTMVAPAVHAGAEPVFYPVSAEGVDTAFLAKAYTPRVKALLVAHFFGRPVPMAALREFCDRRGIALIEDCAHALFGVTDGKPVGAWGDFAIGSLTKFLPVPEAGCLASWRRPVNLRLARQSLRAELKSTVDVLEVSVGHQRFVGLNGALSLLFRLKNSMRRRVRADVPPNWTPGEIADSTRDFDSSYASSAPTRVCRLVTRSMSWRRIRERRRANYARLALALDNLPGLRVLYPELPEGAAPYVLPVWVSDPEPRYRALRLGGCPAFRWEWLWPGTPLLPGDEGFSWSRHVFQLPCHQDLTDWDLEWLTAEVRQVVSSSGRTDVAAASRPREPAREGLSGQVHPADAP